MARGNGLDILGCNLWMIRGWLDVHGHPAQNISRSMIDLLGCLAPGSDLDLPGCLACGDDYHVDIPVVLSPLNDAA